METIFQITPWVYYFDILFPLFLNLDLKLGKYFIMGILATSRKRASPIFYK